MNAAVFAGMILTGFGLACLAVQGLVSWKAQRERELQAELATSVLVAIHTDPSPLPVITPMMSSPPICEDAHARIRDLQGRPEAAALPAGTATAVAGPVSHR